MFRKCHIVNFQNFIFWTLERSNYQNKKHKMFRIMSNFVFNYTKHSKTNKTLAIAYALSKREYHFVMGFFG